MNRLALLLLCSVLPVAASAAQQTTLRCSGKEANTLAHAPTGVTRLDAHTLQIAWLHGKQRFRDTPPHDEALAGVHWQYCGFDSASGLHLVAKADGSLFTGVLLEQKSGRVIPAGQVVLLSPDRRHFLASRQPDGLDGEEWLLATTRGRVLWQGTSNLTGKEGEIRATLENPRWTSSGALQATQLCLTDSAQSTATLQKMQGRWRWQTADCPATAH